MVTHRQTLFKKTSLGNARCPHKTGGTPPGVLPMMAREEALPERGTFIRLQVYERVGILSVSVYKRVGKSVI